MAESLHGYDDIHAAAEGIYNALPDDPFGEEAEERPSGTEEGDQEPDSPAEEPEDTTDADAAAELTKDEPQEPDEEVDEGAEDEESEETASEQEGTPVYTVKVDGEEIEVTLPELRAGYSRTASWTRKSQKLSAEQKAFEAELEAVRQERAQYGEGLDMLRQQLQAQIPDVPTTDDPRAWVRYQRKMDELKQVEAEQARLHQKMSEDADRRREEWIEHENQKLRELVPEWQDVDVAENEKKSLAQYALGLGFTEDEVRNTSDHRMILLLKQAAAWAELEEERKKVKGKMKSSPVLKPGKATGKAKSTAPSKRARSQREKLKQSGKIYDGAAVIHGLLGDEFDD